MIAPPGNHPRQPAPQQPGPAATANEQPAASFDQLLEGLQVAQDGFLGGTPADRGARPVGASAPQAEMFNEHGFFGEAAPAKDPPAEPRTRNAGGAHGAQRMAGEQERPMNPLRSQGPTEVVAPIGSVQVSALSGSARASRTGTASEALLPQRPSHAPARASAALVGAGKLPEAYPAETPGAEAAGRASTLRLSTATPRALTRTAVSLATAQGAVSVAVQAQELTQAERERLEQRIAGELARHGLAIGRIAVSAPNASRERD